MAAKDINKTQSLIDSIFQYHNNSLVSQLDKPAFSTFIQTLVNGDDIKDTLIVSATLSQGIEGLLVYILTNTKLIKATIAKAGRDIDSEYAYLKKITGVKRSLSEENGEKRAGISIEFSQGSFGLEYDLENKEIDAFFQAVDDAVRKIKA